MTIQQYRDHVAMCYYILGVLRGLPMQELADAITRAESVGPLLDPTLYRKQAQAMEEDARVVRALLRVQRDLQPYLDRASV